MDASVSARTTCLQSLWYRNLCSGPLLKFTPHSSDPDSRRVRAWINGDRPLNAKAFREHVRQNSLSPMMSLPVKKRKTEAKETKVPSAPFVLPGFLPPAPLFFSTPPIAPVPPLTDPALAAAIALLTSQPVAKPRLLTDNPPPPYLESLPQSLVSPNTLKAQDRHKARICEIAKLRTVAIATYLSKPERADSAWTCVCNTRYKHYGHKPPVNHRASCWQYAFLIAEIQRTTPEGESVFVPPQDESASLAVDAPEPKKQKMPGSKGKKKALTDWFEHIDPLSLV